jgi:predicted nucleic acid-binding protein
MRFALDTNILTYAEGVGDEQRIKTSRELIAALPDNSLVLPAQALGELFRVLTGKAGLSTRMARSAVLGWSDSFEVHDSGWVAFLSAMDLAVDHHIRIWDALILAVSAEANCRVLLSEDMQHGFTWRGVTVINPFARTHHPLLEPFLGN